MNGRRGSGTGCSLFETEDVSQLVRHPVLTTLARFDGQQQMVEIPGRAAREHNDRRFLLRSGPVARGRQQYERHFARQLSALVTADASIGTLRFACDGIQVDGLRVVDVEVSGRSDVPYGCAWIELNCNRVR